MKKLILALFITTLIFSNGVYAEEVEEKDLISQTVETDSEFEIQGTIASVNDSSFTIRGELVAASSEEMERFKTNGIVKEGNFVKVEGKIENNVMMAEEVELLEEDFQEVPELSEEAGVNLKAEAEVEDETLLKAIVDAIKAIFTEQ